MEGYELKESFEEGETGGLCEKDGNGSSEYILQKEGGAYW